MTNFDARLQAQLEHLDASIPMPRRPAISADGRIVRSEPAHRRRRGVVVLLAAAVLLVAASAVVGQRPTYPDIPEPALEAALAEAFAPDCVSPADARTAVRARLDGLGYGDWDIQSSHGPWADTARCTSYGIVVPDHLIVLVAAPGRDAARALAGVRDELMRRCLGRDEAIAFVRSVLAGIGRSDIAVRADPSGPHIVPGDQAEAYEAHVAAGCYVYSSIQNGNRVDLWGR